MKLNKILLLIFGLKRLWPHWITDSAGVWYFDFNGVFSNIDSDLADELATLITFDVNNVNQVVVSGVELLEVTSYTNTIAGRATALATTPSYIWDDDNDILYIRATDWNPPLVYSISIGVSVNVADQKYIDEVNEVVFTPDLIGIPSLSERKDPLFYQRLAFDEFTQNLNNAQRRYDELKEFNLFGARADYYLGDEDKAFSTFTQVSMVMWEESVKSKPISPNETGLSSPCVLMI